MADRRRVAILISGRGSNMRSIVEADTGLDIKAVISNRPDAGGLVWARGHGLHTDVVDHRKYASREAFDADLSMLIADHAPDLVLLAGFMRILSPAFIGRFHERILNIHPSLLPSFKGLDTHARALKEGVKIHGASVHVVVPEMDSGPLITQAAVPVLDADTPETLAARVLAAEHRIYPLALKLLAEGRVRIVDGRCMIEGSAAEIDELLVVPNIRYSASR